MSIATNEQLTRWMRGTIRQTEVAELLLDGFNYTLIEHATDVKRCAVMMKHTDQPGQPSYQCVLPSNHQEHDTDHVDSCGHHAKVLVSQASIRKLEAMETENRRTERLRVESALAEHIGALVRGGVVVDDPMLESGLSEKHLDGSVSFEVWRRSDRDHAVTVRVSPGYKR